MKILVTGCAGFVGFHLAQKLLSKKNYNVYGIDNLNRYYDVKLKYDRLKVLKKNKNFNFTKLDISKFKKLTKNFKDNKYDYVINLAAQAGVRYSITNPDTYFDNNVSGFYNILQVSKKFKIKHLIFASTSSVYGDQNKWPLKENFSTDKPLSFYAATKKINEVMAYSYSNIYKLPCTGLRFFTIYGPYGRPDMALFKFVKNISSSKKINLFNNGNHYRDFTYVDDIVESIVRLIKKPSKHKIPYEIFNIGGSKPHHLKKTFLKYIEEVLNKKAIINNLPMQVGDVFKTHADTKKLQNKINFKPQTNLNEGINNFILWFKKYFK